MWRTRLGKRLIVVYYFFLFMFKTYSKLKSIALGPAGVLAGYVIVFLAAYNRDLKGIFPFIFTDESSEAFIQFFYYVTALLSKWSMFWDHYLYLPTQAAPQSPLLSPVTLVLLVLCQIFQVKSFIGSAILFATGSYCIQILMGFSVYLLLRSLAIGQLAAFAGGIIYSYNWFAAFFGIHQGYYRATAMLFVPLIFLFLIRFTQGKGNPLTNLICSGLFLGFALAGNGDVKTTFVFLPLLALWMLSITSSKDIWKKVFALLLVLFIGAALFLGQFSLTFDAFQESSRQDFGYEKSANISGPLRLTQGNLVLSYSQTSYSLLTGILFPQTFFQVSRYNPIIGVSEFVPWEQRISITLPILFLILVGISAASKLLNRVFLINFAILISYFISGTTFFGSLWEPISRIFMLRYPTRASVLLYFMSALYAALGVQLLFSRKLVGHPAIKKMLLGLGSILLIIFLIIS
ncbi:MAG: hypothetical protein HY537_18475, partial [Deltaproteobacteria bacterium]|nr:hypothetical protein [Deltaproteobacteria bacterium]